MLEPRSVTPRWQAGMWGPRDRIGDGPQTASSTVSRTAPACGIWSTLMTSQQPALPTVQLDRPENLMAGAHSPWQAWQADRMRTVEHRANHDTQIYCMLWLCAQRRFRQAAGRLDVSVRWWSRKREKAQGTTDAQTCCKRISTYFI